MEYGRSSPFSPGCLVIYRLKSVSLMFYSVESYSMHNQSFSALLGVPRGYKSTPKVEHRASLKCSSCTTCVAVSLHEEKDLAAF